MNVQVLPLCAPKAILGLLFVPPWRGLLSLCWRIGFLGVRVVIVGPS